MQDNQPREDGPALQKLFATLDGPPGRHVPAEQALTGGIKVPEPEAEDSEHVGPVNYPQRLHEAGEAAIQIVANMCESEFAGGVPGNIPEPILGWYVMTLTYQLCVLEACLANYDQRKALAGQLQAARNVFARYQTPYGDGVREEVAEVLQQRYRPKGLEAEAADYRGVLK